MSNIKKVFKIYSPVEYKNIESYLEEMALKGWMFKEIKNLFYTFEKVDSIDLHFNVVVLSEKDGFDYQDMTSENTLIECCEDRGWTHCASTPSYQVFYTNQEMDIVKIHTDENEEYSCIMKATMKKDLFALPLIFVMFFSFLSQLKYFTYDHIFSNQELISIISPVLAMVALLITLSTPIVWLIKNKINLQNNKPFTHFTNIFISFKNRMFYLIMLIYLLLLVISFADTFSGGGFVVIPLLFGLLLPMLAAVLMLKRFKKIKKSRKSNIAMYIGVSLLTFMVGISGMFFYLSNMEHGEYKEGLATNNVLEFSDFGEYKVVTNHMRKKTSVFTPVYLDYYESVRDKNSDIDHIETLYIECLNQKVVDYVVKNTLIEYKRYITQSEFVPLSNEVWSIDQGYYLSDNKSILLLVKDKRIMILRSDMDFEEINNIEICKSKLDLN